MSLIKNQHFVPQSYLKHFSHDGQLHVFDKSLRKKYPSNVRKVASQQYFYDLPAAIGNTGVDRQAVEKLLQRMEDKHIVAIRELLQEASLRCTTLPPTRRTLVSRQVRGDLSHFLAVQMLRTREFRFHIAELITKTVKGLADIEFELKGIDLPLHKYDLKVNEDWLAVQHARFLVEPGPAVEFAEIVYKHIWVVGLNATPTLFYTSDHPVVKHAHASHPVKSMAGLASPGIEMAIPLSPRIVLMLFERNYFAHLANLDGRGVDLEEEHVERYNRMQVRSSFQQVYSMDGNLGLAEYECQADTTITMAEKTRVDVNIPIRNAKSGYLLHIRERH